MASSSPDMAKPDQEGSPPKGRRKVKRQLNTRLLVGTLIVVAVLGPSAYFWREFQVERTAGAFLTRADSLEQEEKWGQAASYLFRYLQLRPDDVDVRIRLAGTFEKSDQTGRLKSRTIDLYFRALGIAPDGQQTELRTRLADLLLEMQRFQAADTEAEKLLEADAQDAQGLRVRAFAHYGLFRMNARTAKGDGDVSIGEEFETARAQDPDNIGLVATLAQIYRGEPALLSKEKQELSAGEQARHADGLVDQMVEANAEDITAYLTRYLYRNQYELPDAGKDLVKALELSPDHFGALLLAAEFSRQEALRILREEGSTEDTQKQAKQLLAEASGHYDHIVKDIAPRSEQAYMGLGDIHLLLGDADKAVETWQQGLRIGDPNSILLNLRLIEVFIAMQRIEPAEKALKVLKAAVDERIATLPRPTRLSLERSISMLSGRCFAAKNESGKAIVELKRVLASRPSSDAEVRQAIQAEMLLGSIYGSMSEWNLAAAAFERAATLEPTQARPRLAAATAWANFNQPEMAIRHYQMALDLDTVSVASGGGQAVTGVQRLEASFALARACYQQQTRLPENDRNWGPYLKAIQGAMATEGEATLPNAWRADLLQADYLVAVGEENGDRRQGILNATEQLRQAEQKYPTSESLFLGLVLGYERYEASADADRAMDKLESLTGKSATTYVLRSRLLSTRGQYDEARQILHKGLEALPAEDHSALNRALARVDLDEGDVDVPQSQLAELHKQDPKNASLIRQLLELAFEQNNLPEVEQWEQKLYDLEGPDSPYADYSKVRRLLAGSTDLDDPKFAEAVALLGSIEERRPNTPMIRMLRGMVLESQGERQEAIDTYMDAIRLGMQSAAAYERLVTLLGNEKRFDEARDYLEKAKGRDLSSKRLGTLEIAVAAGDDKFDEAEGFARRVAAEDTKDASSQLNLAQVLAANDKPEEAEAAFQEAIKRAPADLRTYLALFSFYVRTEHNDLATQTLEELEENLKNNADLPKEQLAAVLAEGYERLGDTEKADAAYREAQEADPTNVVNGLRLADFLTRNGESDEAETVLRSIVDENPTSDAARYRLADILVARGGKAEWEEALQLLEQSRSDESVFNIDRRLQALLLIRRGGRTNLKNATEILEALVLDIQEPSDADRLLLAQVYEAEIARLNGEGDDDGADEKLQAAREQYVAVVGQAKPNPSHLALFVEFLLRNELADAATGYLDRLESLTSDDLGTMRLRARWLNSKERIDEVKPLVEKLAKKLQEKIVDDPRQEAQLALSVGAIYSEVELLEEAEIWYRRLIELEPTGYAPLLSVLARLGRMQEVIDVCTQAAQSDESTRPASLLASILVSEKADDEQFQQAEPILSKAIEDHPDDVELLFSMANLRISRKQMDEAAELYRRVIALRPKHLAALNNLATLLSEMPEKNAEALATIEKAIELAGEQPALLDTKGMILVYGGDPEQAVPFLKSAAFSSGADPRYHFHLAVAHVRNGDLEEARNALQEANSGDLKGQFLTELDLELLAELEEQLGN